MERGGRGGIADSTCCYVQSGSMSTPLMLLPYLLNKMFHINLLLEIMSQMGFSVEFTTAVLNALSNDDLMMMNEALSRGWSS